MLEETILESTRYEGVVPKAGAGVERQPHGTASLWLALTYLPTLVDYLVGHEERVDFVPAVFGL